MPVGSQPLDQRGRWTAALLATLPHPFLSHLSAAAHRGLAREATTIHITTASRCPRELRGVTVHRARSIDPADVTHIDGFRVTGLPRTLLDLAETLSPARFASIFEEADRRELLDWKDLHATAARNPGRRGLKPYLDLISHYQPTPGAEEGLEREFQLLLHEEGLPLPEVNVLLAGHKVDCYWPAANFVVELDSRTHHSHWQARERDLVRDADLLRLGIPTLRVTSRRMRRRARRAGRRPARPNRRTGPRPRGPRPPTSSSSWTAAPITPTGRRASATLSATPTSSAWVSQRCE